MSSNCPPQLHLSLPPNTTSFKRSFEQFGFDLESPIGVSEAGGSGLNNDRNKRARSASSFSDGEDSADSSRSSTVASGSGTSGTSMSENEGESDRLSVLSTTRPTSAPRLSFSIPHTSLDPPRLPTPEIQDIEMPDYPLVEPVDDMEASTTPVLSPLSETDEQYRISLERFNAFDSQISALRRSRSFSPLSTSRRERSPTPPPTLPPLALSEDQTSLNTSAIPFLHPPIQTSAPSLPESFYSFGIPLRSQRPGSSVVHEGERREEIRVLPHELHGDNNHDPPFQRSTTRSVSSPFPPRPSSSSVARDQDGRHSDGAPRIDLASFRTIWSRLQESPSPEPDETEYSAFRERLSSALDGLRSQSPLVRDLSELQPSSSRTTHSSPHNRTQDETEGDWQEQHVASPSFPERRPQPRRSVSSLDSLARRDSSEASGLGERHPFLREMDQWFDSPGARPLDFAAESWILATGQGSPPAPESHAWDNENSSLPPRSSLSDPSTRRGSGSHRRSQEPITMERDADVLLEELNDLQSTVRGELRDLRGELRDLRSTVRSHPPPRRPAAHRNGDEGRHSIHPLLRSSAGSEQARRIAGASSYSALFSDPLRDSDSDESNEGYEVLNYEGTHGLPPVLPPFRSAIQSVRTSSSGRASWSSTIPDFNDDTLPEPGLSASSTSHSSRPFDAPYNASIHRLRSRVYGSQSRFGALNSLASESAAESRRQNARAELLERLSRLPSNHLSESANTDVPQRGTIGMSYRDRMPFAASLPPLLSWPRQPFTSRISSPPRLPEPARGNSRGVFRNFSPESSTIDLTDDSDDIPGATSHLSGDRRARQSPSNTIGQTFPSPLRQPASRSPVRSGFRRIPTPPTFRRPHESVSTARSSSEEDLPQTSSTVDRGFYDSQLSTITDMASAIFHNTERNLYNRYGSIYEISPEEQDAPIQFLDVPSLPSPELGGIFEQPNTNEPEQSSRSMIDAPALSLGRGSSSSRDYRYNPRPRQPPLSASDYHRAMPLSRVSPPTPPGSRAQPSGNPYRDIDPNSFAPGPFRNTIQRALDSRRRGNQNTSASHPPSIPPLQFPIDDLSGAASSEELHRQPTSRPTRLGYSPPIDTNARRHPLVYPNDHSPEAERARRHSARNSLEHHPSQTTPFRVSWSPPAEHHTRELPLNRPSSILQNFLTRLEASRTNSPDSSQPPTRLQDVNSEVEGFSRAIEVLRQDELNAPSRQLGRLRRDQLESELRRVPPPSSSPWGSIDSGLARHRFGPPRRPGSMSAEWDGSHVNQESISATAQTFAMRSRNSSSRSPTRDRETEIARDRLAAARLRARHARFIRRIPDMTSLHNYLPGLRNSGDYVRDEDFDESYENLISLAASLGDAKPRATPGNVVSELESALYKDWATSDSDQRCPICLDDYTPTDPVLKLAGCSHWLHKDCLEQWLRGASTCPVCREAVRGKRSSHNENEPGSSRRRDDSESRGGSNRGAPGGHWAPPPWR